MNAYVWMNILRVTVFAVIVIKNFVVNTHKRSKWDMWSDIIVLLLMLSIISVNTFK